MVPRNALAVVVLLDKIISPEPEIVPEQFQQFPVPVMVNVPVPRFIDAVLPTKALVVTL